MQCDKKVFKDPLQELPAYEIVFIHEKLSMLFAASREWKPWELLSAEFLQQSNSGKRLKSVEFNELKDFLVEYFPVFAIHKVSRENISDKLSEKIGYISVVSGAFLK